MLTGTRDLLDVLVGGLCFVTGTGLLAYAAYLAVRRLHPSLEPRVRFTAAAIVGLGAIVAVFQLLSPWRLYTREAAWLTAAALAAGAHAAWRRHSDIGGDIRSLRAALRSAARSRGAVLLVLGIMAVIVVAARAAALPPMVWDSVTYHLVFASRFVQARGFATIDAPFAMDRYDHFPKNWEVVASWFLLPFHGDLIAGFVNIALLVCGWLAAYNVAREADLGRENSALAATAICTSPLLYAYATSENADIFVFTLLMSGVLFALRYVRRGDDRDAVLLCVAAGLAIGTKYTALPTAGLLLLIGTVAAVRRHVARGSVAQLLGVMAIGLALIAALGLRQYVVNARATGNPIYPISIGRDLGRLSRGSPFTDLQIRDKGGIGTRRDDLSQFVKTLNYYPDWRNVTSAGPKYVLLIPLALLAFVRPPRDAALAVRLIVGLALAGLAFTYLPGDGFAALSRRFWPAVAPRFMATYFGLFAIGGLAALARFRPRTAELVRLLVAGFIVWDVMRTDTLTTAGMPLAAGAAALAVVFAAPVWTAVSRWRPALLVPATATAVVLALVPLTMVRAESRWRQYSTATDVHPLPRDFVDGWRDLDRPNAPATIALAAGWDDAGENWFVYPLLGRRLQNHVLYVPLRRSAPVGTRGFILRESGDYDEWLQGVRDRNVTIVFAQAPWPIEDEWMQQHPEVFRLRTSGPGFRVYAVQPYTAPARGDS